MINDFGQTLNPVVIKPATPQWQNKKIVLIGFLLFALCFMPLVVLYINYKPQPTRAADIISPAADKEKQTLANRTYSLDYYLSLANSFLGKATRLANDDALQSDEDKQKIISTINEALKAVNEAISYYPTNPQTYLTRAQIYQKIKHLYPEAEPKANADLETANQLIEAQKKNQTGLETLPKNNNDQPLEFIPLEKANLAQKIIIAEPNRQSAIRQPADQQSVINTNSLSGESVLFAGEKEVIVKAENLGEKDLVYVVPQNSTNNETLYVKAKNHLDDWFKVGLDKPSTQDIGFKWWVIKDDKGN